MDRFGLIGDPIRKSLSPALFTAGYDGKYRYDLIEGSDFNASWEKFLEGYKAINVTAPFKEYAFAQAVALAKNGFGSVSGPCLKTGATNLVVKRDGGIHAYNSDFTGIILSVAESLFPGIVGQCYDTYGDKGYVKVHQFVRENVDEYYGDKPQALVVGCGGAGKAAAVAAAEMGYSTVLMNRTQAKAGDFALGLPEYGFIIDSLSDFKAAFRECELVIYTLPLAIEQIASLDEDDFKGNGTKKKTILEANYKTPGFTAGDAYSYVSGKKWILYQALTGYGIMSGEAPDFKAMERVLGL